MTPEEMTTLYVKTINGHSNGWGQCIVDAPGEKHDGAQSHHLWGAIVIAVGEDKASDMITKEFKCQG